MKVKKTPTKKTEERIVAAKSVSYLSVLAGVAISILNLVLAAPDVGWLD